MKKNSANKSIDRGNSADFRMQNIMAYWCNKLKSAKVFRFKLATSCFWGVKVRCYRRKAHIRSNPPVVLCRNDVVHRKATVPESLFSKIQVSFKKKDLSKKT